MTTPTCPKCSKPMLVMKNLISCRHCKFYAENNNENLSNPILNDEPIIAKDYEKW